MARRTCSTGSAREIAATGDARLAALLEEVSAYPAPEATAARYRRTSAIAVPLRMRAGDGEELTFISTVATFGTAVDVTVAELSIEAFFPADATTAAALQKLLPQT